MRNLIPEKIIENLKQNRFLDEFECFSIFVDISGFTSTTEALMKHGQEGAEVLSDILRYLFDTTVKAVYEHGGYVTKYAGDAFTALFEPAEDHRQTALNVLNTALITNRFFAENKIFRSKFGDFEFGVKVGMGFGKCQCGIVGTDNEKSYYFSGPAVDLCAMAEHNAVKGDIWMSEGVHEYISDIVISPEKNELYGLNFYKVTRTKKFDPASSKYKPGVFNKDLIYKVAGKPESEFPIGEFRDVISVFISFEGQVDLNKLMNYLYELKETYGSSHPVIDFGDKGGNILLFFGAPVSYENNSFRALSLILKLLEFAGNNFSIRAGLAKGVVYCGFNGSELRNEFTCLGNTVNQSARFMMKAEWGQVLIDKKLSSDENFITEHLADIQYKGREGLIPTYILKSKAEIKDIFFKGSFVGREKELTRLRKYLEPLQRGKNCGVIYVDGEAGIGKSRLVNHIRQEFTRSGGVNWFYFVCDDIIKDPYNPFRYFFNRYFDFEEDAVEKNTEKFDLKFERMLERILDIKFRKKLKSKRDYIAYFLKLKLRDQSVLLEEPDERQNSIILALTEFFRTFTEISSLALEIDNASYIDQDSLKLFKRISLSLKRSPLVMIFNCRLKDNGQIYDYDLSPKKRIRLKNLNKKDFKELTKERLDLKAVPKETLKVLEDKSKLNPLFLEQMAMYIKENSVLDAKNRIKDVSALPSGIDGIILARVDKLNSDLKELVKTASCIGNEIPVDLISYLFRNKYGNISKYLCDLEKEDIFILFSELSYLFRYSVIRDVLYNIQLKKILRELHGEIGKAIEKIHAKNLDNYFSVLAYHYENAENIEKALFYHEKAGFLAKENYQNDQALYHFNKIHYLLTLKKNINDEDWINLDVSENYDDIKKVIEIGLIRFHFYYAIHQDISLSSKIIKTLSLLANKTNDEFLISQTLMEGSLILSNSGKYEESNKKIERAVNIYKKLGLPYEVALSYLSLGKNQMFIGKMEKAIEYYNIALEKSESIEDVYKREKIKAKIFGDMGISFDYSGNFEKALEFYNKQLEITEKLNLRIERSLALLNIGVVYHLTGNLTKAKEFYELRLKLIEELGRRVDTAQTLNNLGFLYKDLNNLTKAIAYHKRSYNISRELNDFNTMASASVNLGHVYKIQKKYSKSENEYDKCLDISKRFELKHIVAECLIELGEVYFHTDRKKEAFSSLREGLSIAEEIGFAEYIEKGKIILKKYFPEKKSE
ncbi:MAG: tetratricopeptide repeat protein [Candidatus Delongbacteria bacterium]|nr:tetratricopeptide repeat protein [Candidatus Delongbacteria bacterium]